MRKPILLSDLPDGIAFPELDPRLTTPADPADPADPDDITIDFAPVPRLRNRRNGWTEAKQRGFIAALARCGSVAAAARCVGMTTRSAYRLIDAPGGAEFAAAWDEAVDIGLSRLRLDSLQRSLEGDYVPVYRRGKLVRVEHRRNDKLAIALLSGREREVETYRRAAVARREYGQDMGALDAARGLREAQIVAAENAYEGEVRRLVGTIYARCAESETDGPSIRQL